MDSGGVLDALFSLEALSMKFVLPDKERREEGRGLVSIRVVIKRFSYLGSRTIFRNQPDPACHGHDSIAFDLDFLLSRSTLATLLNHHLATEVVHT
ncbi:hypothetical protein E2562_023011 [Oryza meyeriana var. granulata]|uniref:Uncharacterized protein n=1 Tax=Oryza meyeriana var. granulata TaxID=110450 RepID=A0A6G1EYD7_9ORYZ|nr:hypothetical protein E2562_023011 [Oryza meyeriana var. granulata]